MSTEHYPIVRDQNNENDDETVIEYQITQGGETKQ